MAYICITRFQFPGRKRLTVAPLSTAKKCGNGAIFVNEQTKTRCPAVAAGPLVGVTD
jgi:hypothetical protein